MSRLTLQISYYFHTFIIKNTLYRFANFYSDSSMLNCSMKCETKKKQIDFTILHSCMFMHKRIFYLYTCICIIIIFFFSVLHAFLLEFPKTENSSPEEPNIRPCWRSRHLRRHPAHVGRAFYGARGAPKSTFCRRYVYSPDGAEVNSSYTCPVRRTSQIRDGRKGRKLGWRYSLAALFLCDSTYRGRNVTAQYRDSAIRAKTFRDEQGNTRWNRNAAKKLNAHGKIKYKYCFKKLILFLYRLL